MTRLRRTLVLALAALAVLLGLTSPAGAAYGDKATLGSAVTTLAVAAPATLSTAGTKCTSTYDATTRRYTTTLHAKVSWGTSPTRGVTGYVVTAVFADGTRYPVTQVAAPATSVTGDYDAYYATQNIRVAITTTTSYGWTATSPMSGVIKC